MRPRGMYKIQAGEMRNPSAHRNACPACVTRGLQGLAEWGTAVPGSSKSQPRSESAARLGMDVQASAVGIMGALRTGNPIVDMLIAMAVPLIFKLVLDAAHTTSLREILGQILFFWSSYYTREIEHKVLQNGWGNMVNMDKDLRNNVLIKAIQLYLDNQKIEYRNASVALVSMQQSRQSCWGDDDDEGENTPAGKLKRFKVARKPPKNRWTAITSPKVHGKVELMVSESEHDKGEKAEKTTIINVYKLRSRQKGAIDAFVDECYAWYITELKKQEDNSRYLYEMQLNPGKSSGGDDDSSASRVFKRYKLSDEKQFSSLFFDDKEKLLAVLKHFTGKTGKYAVQGYPHKLGLLLHGPPGTGKTSMIKALAQYTGRSIVNVPLARISTNQELMDIMFDQQYLVMGDEVPIKLGFKDVIFVMEDVDAASKVVQRRDGKTNFGGGKIELHADAPLNPDEKSMVGGVLEATPWHLLLGSDDPNVQELVDELLEKSERLKAAALSPDTMRAVAAELRVPKPPPPSDDKDRAELEKKSPAERAMATAQMVHEAMSQRCERHETIDQFVKMHACALRRLLKAGGAVDRALEDELLGVAPPADAGKPKAPLSAKLGKAAASWPIDGGASTGDRGGDEDDEKDGMDIQMMQAMMMSMMDTGGASNRAGGDAPPGGAGARILPSSSIALKKDTLNLAGLLNVLDGVVDTPERIVVMTTIHPEILDPDLTRPGRIDQRLSLGYMRWQNVVEMIKHYFQLGTEGLDESLVRRVREAILGNDAKGLPALNLTPAQVEQLSAVHDDVASMVAALEAKAAGMIQVSARRPAKVSQPLSATQPVIIVDEVKEDDDEFVMGMPVPPKRQSSVTVTYE